jgi:hypothetical protein
VNSLEVPFYYVPGNHDISNPWMEGIWKECLGSPYYHFLYKGALFIVLNTEDGGTYGIKPAQVEDIRKVLDENPNPRWTFVFMHRPLWFYPNQAGFEGIDEVLQNRPHTIFSGHEHHYLHSNRKGNKRYILATTGGGSGMRGEVWGEFDHITHVTLTKDGPKVVHLKLDGFVDEAIVNESNEGMVKLLCSGNFFGISAIVAESSLEDRLDSQLLLCNDQDQALKVTGTMESPIQGWSFSIGEVNCIVESHRNFEIPISLEKTNPTACNLSDLPPVEITLTGSYMLDSGEATLPGTQRWYIDYHRKFPVFESDTELDGLFPVDEGEWIAFTPAEFCKESWDYHGLDDLEGVFMLGEDENFLYVRLRVKDDVWLFSDPRYRDQWDFWFQALPGGNEVHVALYTDKPENGPLKVTQGPVDTEGYIRFLDQSAQVEVAIPKTSIGISESLRFNLAMMDHDITENTKPSVLYWKPPWHAPQDYEGSGVFRRDG